MKQAPCGRYTFSETASVRDRLADAVKAIDLFLVLQKTYRTMLARVEESKKKVGLGDSDFRVLETLFHQGPLPVNVIGERIDLTTGSITTAVDRMEAKWLVARKYHPTDGRVRLVELTSKGRRLIEKACTQLTAEMDAAFASLSQAERRSLIEMLKRVVPCDEEPADPPEPSTPAAAKRR
jgi:MarR family transcriptional regulator, 2-MHQ and catechol-resistance regulon repressor